MRNLAEVCSGFRAWGLGVGVELLGFRSQTWQESVGLSFGGSEFRVRRCVMRNLAEAIPLTREKRFILDPRAFLVQVARAQSSGFSLGFQGSGLRI